jgi:cytochrome c553
MKLLLSAMVVGMVALSGSAVAGDAAAGKAKSAMCAACHGAGGEGNPAMNAPRLSGQLEGYLTKSMTAYKSGARNDPMMSAQAKTLSDADMANLSAYYSSLK